MSVVDERELRLPVWARELICDLRSQVAAKTGPLARELATLRPRVELLRSKNEALTELLNCAAKGEHPTAQVIMKVLRTYDLTLTERSDL